MPPMPMGGMPGGGPDFGGPPPGAGGPGGPGGPNPFGQPSSGNGKMNATQIANSANLKAIFPAYVNGLHLKGADGKLLTLDRNGNGPFKDAIKTLLITSAQIAQKKGVDISKTSWITVKNGAVVGMDWDGFVRTVGRMKQTSAFDSPALTTGENNEFGSETVDNQHFTKFGMSHNTVAGAAMADSRIIKMMNPMDYIGTRGAKVSPLWRIRHGAIDRDTSLAIPTILATKLANCGYSVDFAIPWNTPHSGDYDLDELFSWIDSHAKGK